MNLADLVRAAVDPRNITIGADIAGHVTDVLADGRVTPREVIDAAHGAVDTALMEYGADDTVVYREDASEEAVRNRVADFVDAVSGELEKALSDRELTCGELNDLAHKVLVGVLDVVAPLPEKQG